MIETRPRVFISYPLSDVDRTWLLEFAQSLERLGVATAYLDDDIRLGDASIDSLERAFRDSNLVVLVFSPSPANLPNLLFDLGAAIGMGKQLLIVAPPDVTLDSLPLKEAFRAQTILLQGSPIEAANAVAAAAEAAAA